MRKIIAMIPSRYGSSRFPGKPLAILKGKPMIQWVYEHVSQVEAISDIYVATDDKRIFEAVKKFGGNVLMTSKSHTCGTERLAECAKILSLDDEDIILNIQGDEPMVRKEMILDLLHCFDTPDVYMGTLKKRIEKENELTNPNVVKVISDVNDNAIYFSRFCIPFERDGGSAIHYKHIGVYGYTKKFLLEYSEMPKTELEMTELLEQLRVIEHGLKIKVKETRYQTIGVDTPRQLEEVERLMEVEDE